MSIYDYEILTHSLELICPYCILILVMDVLYMLRYWKKISSGGLEVSFSIYSI